MRIIANGKPREVQDGTTIAAFIEGLGWKPEWVVVEYNSRPIERAVLPTQRLREGDRIEVVRAVAGGC